MQAKSERKEEPKWDFDQEYDEEIDDPYEKGAFAEELIEYLSTASQEEEFSEYDDEMSGDDWDDTEEEYEGDYEEDNGWSAFQRMCEEE